VYAYFPSKQALFEAAVDADVACLVEDAFPEIDHAEGEIDLDLHLLFKRLVNTLRIHPLAQRVLAGGEGDGIGRWMQLSAGHRLRTALTAVLRREQNMGRVRREIDATVLALGLETILASLLAAVLHESGAVPTEAEEAVFAVLNAALRPSADG
jgi:AcrR family transcriptional regulator